MVPIGTVYPRRSWGKFDRRINCVRNPASSSNGQLLMDLFEEAARLGVQTAFTDVHGQQRRVDAVALKAVLDALPEAIQRRMLPAVPVLQEGQRGRSFLSEHCALPVTWTLTSESGRRRRGTVSDRSIEWPADLECGIYHLELAGLTGDAERLPLLVAPATAYAGKFDREWLLAVQLYSVRSTGNWGIGDFTDLQALIRFAADAGAGGVGLNPLHALFDDRPNECSPYSPNSRQFLNPLYIDVASLRGVGPNAEARAEIARLQNTDFVDYAAIADLKRRALRRAYEVQRAAIGQGSDFEAFRIERGDVLRRFACFEVLRHSRQTPWWTWEDWSKPSAAQYEAFASGPDQDAVRFIEFVQWVADRQLRACRDLAKSLGRAAGLYLDIAVGVQNDGFDAWDERHAISRHLGVGAPPDALNTAGQSWGLAGFNAAGLEARNFAPFRDMLRTSMRYAGAVRLDHVLGLQRLYLVPHGFPPSEGVYVQMPFEAMLAVTALESQANCCVVIGEDLGTVPEGFRDALARWAIWSYRVMMFEQDYHSKAFFPPDTYPSNALVTFSTHDLPTFAGWRSLSDLATKRSLGIDPGESDDARRHSIAMLHNALRDAHIDADDFYSVTRFLSQTPSRLLAISLEDLLNVIDQPNIPGTVDEHPNWRQRLAANVEDFGRVLDVSALQRATSERSG